MNILLKLFLSVSVCAVPVKAVFVVPGEYDYNVSEKDTSPFPFACQIFTPKAEGLSTGTGSFVAPNACLTIRHVPQGLAPQQEIEIEFFQRGQIQKRTVDRIEYCDLGVNYKNDPYDGPALLFFNPPVEGINFPGIGRLNKADMVPEKLTVMGFGAGGLLDEKNIHPLDIKKEKGYDSIFRYVEGVSGDIRLKDDYVQHDSAAEMPLILDVSQPYVKMGPGDSGSALLNEEGDVIGITQAGRNRFYENRQKILSSFSFKRRIISTLERINYFVPGQFLSNYIDNFYKNMLGAVVKASNDDITYMNVRKFLETHHPDIYYANCPEAAEIKRMHDNMEVAPLALSLKVANEKLLSPALINEWKNTEGYLEYMSDHTNHVVFGNTFLVITPTIKEWINNMINDSQQQ